MAEVERRMGGKAGRSVWERMSWFSSRWQTRQAPVCPNDIANDSNTSSPPRTPPVVESPSSSTVSSDNSCPNSEVDEANCLRPSVTRALFHQTERAAGGSPCHAKRTWRKKGRIHRSHELNLDMAAALQHDSASVESPNQLTVDYHQPLRLTRSATDIRCNDSIFVFPSPPAETTVKTNSLPSGCQIETASSTPRSSLDSCGSHGYAVVPTDQPETIYLRTHLPVPVGGIGAVSFKHQRKVMSDVFKDLNDEQKNAILRELLESCDVPQFHTLSLRLESLHGTCPPNCCDVLSWLPKNLSLHILSYLDPTSLCQASRACRSWNRLAEDQVLWSQFCRQSTWQISQASAQKQIISHILPDGSIHWKQVFGERYRVRQNWLRGNCNVRTFKGHSQGISCVQFDDTRIVSGSTDNSIKVWNIRTDTPWSVMTLTGHSGTVRCLQLEGNRLVSGSTDRTIKVWDLATQSSWSSIACRVTMQGHGDTVRCLQVDDEKVVSGSYDKTLKVWDVRTGKCRLTLRGHAGAVLCVQFDDSKVLSGSADKTIKMWSLSSGTCLSTFCGHRDAVTCLQFDATKVISGSLDCNLKFWDIHTAKCINTIDWATSEGHTGVVRCLQADAWRVVSAADDRTIKVWCGETGQRLVTLRDHTDGVTSLQFNDSMIVSGSYDKTVKLWDFSL